MNSKNLAAAALLFLTGVPALAHGRGKAFDDRRLRVCRALLREPLRRVRETVLEDCWDFYWHGSDPEDRADRYDRVIQIGEIHVSQYPVQKQTYGNVAYLYWSRWRNDHDPNSVPRNEDYLGRARRILAKGVAVPANRRDFVFLWDTGMTIYDLVQDMPDLRPIMVQVWKEALSVANLRDPKQKQSCVNIAKQLGYHYYKQEIDKPKSLEYFRYAVRLQPSNRPAVRMMRQLEAELGVTPLPLPTKKQ